MNTAAAAFRKSKKTQIEMFVYLKLKKKIDRGGGYDVIYNFKSFRTHKIHFHKQTQKTKN